MLNITSGCIRKPQKVVIYGPEGIGKTTFASKFPDPVFIDTEGSTYHMDVRRINKPESWTELVETVKQFAALQGICRTLVLDTADWAEMLCIESVCRKYQKNGIEDFGYGKGYVFVQEEFGRLLNALTEVINAGMNVVLTAHAKMRKFEQPDELGAYDRWEMKLSKQVAPMVKEWADMVLFANYKTYSVAVDDKKKKHKAQGGKRVMYTSHHPCWDAKNRHGLPDELPLDYTQIAHCIEPDAQQAARVSEPQPTPTVEPQTTNYQAPVNLPQKTAVQTVPAGPELSTPPQTPMFAPEPSVTVPDAAQRDAPGDIPPKLQTLMHSAGVAEDEVRRVFAEKGYYPFDTPWQVLKSEGFVDGWIIPYWPQILDVIQNNRDNEPVPF